MERGRAREILWPALLHRRWILRLWPSRYVGFEPCSEKALTDFISVAIQHAKLSGFSPIIVTASSSNRDYLVSLGATHVIDRSTPLSSLPAAVKAITQTPIKYAYDTISQADTQNAAYDVIDAHGGTLILTHKADIKSPIEGKEVLSPVGFVHLPAHRDFGVELLSKLNGLFESGDFKVRLRVQPLLLI